MGIPTARFSLLTGGGKIPDHDNEDGHSGGNHDHVDEHDSIPDICHGRTDDVRVNFFWPV